MFFFIMILLLFIFSGCGSASDEAASSSDPEAIRESQINEDQSAGYGYVPEYQVLEKILEFFGYSEEWYFYGMDLEVKRWNEMSGYICWYPSAFGKFDCEETI